MNVRYRVELRQRPVAIAQFLRRANAGCLGLNEQLVHLEPCAGILDPFHQAACGACRTCPRRAPAPSCVCAGAASAVAG